MHHQQLFQGGLRLHVSDFYFETNSFLVTPCPQYHAFYR